jgi:flavin reductase (DIM6/NTAB) family NADH-FMN oxidoreductase RutF
MEVLQTSALPLGYVALRGSEFDSTFEVTPPYAWRDVPNPAFLDAMARLPAGVVVISTRVGDDFKGLTASSLVSISLEPPMVLVGLDGESATRAAILETRAFNVSLLTRSQEFIADRFAGRAPSIDARWTTLAHHLGANGIPLIDGCAAWLECNLAQVHHAGDHDILVGEVVAATSGRGDPLILWDRTFWSLH